MEVIKMCMYDVMGVMITKMAGLKEPLRVVDLAAMRAIGT